MFLVALMSFLAVASAHNPSQCNNIQIDTDKVQGQCCIFPKNSQESVDIEKHLHEYFAKDGAPPSIPYRHPAAPIQSRGGQTRPLGPGEDSIDKNNQDESTTLPPESVPLTSQVPQSGDNEETPTYYESDDRIAIDVPKKGCPSNDQVRDPSGTCVSKF